MNINGAEVFVEKLSGNGNLNFILIHNAGGNHYFFTHQIEALKKYGNVIWLDLPGHSNSKDIASYRMTDLSAIINQVCQQLSLNKICLIGLNNGADIVIDIALTYSLPIKCIILIDPPIFMEQSFVAEIHEFINQLEQDNYDKFVDSLADALFIETDRSNKEIAISAFNGVNKRALQDMFKGLIEWDTQSIGKLKQINYPTLCILTDEHHCTYEKMRQEAPHFVLGKVIGSKCWATLEVPEQINAMIGRFLKLNR